MPQPKAEQSDTRRITHLEHVGLSIYWAASNFVWGALLLIVIASQVEQMTPANKGVILGLIFSLGAIPAVIVPLVAGPHSDRCRSPFGRRRPYILVGGLINVLGLGLMYWAFSLGNLLLYLTTYFVIQIGNNIAIAAYSGVIPDMVPADQRGTASGYMAVMSKIGTLFGVGVGGVLAGQGQYLLCHLLLMGVLLAGILVSMFGIKEQPLIERLPPLSLIQHIKSLWVDPRKYPDFAWVWVNRALVMVGFYSVIPFILYFLGDVIGVPSPETVSAQIVGLVLVSAIISGYIGGARSDRSGRKRILLIANYAMAAMAFLLAFARNLESVVMVATLFGLGYGAYVSVDWALGTDVLPKREDVGKDMAVWHVSMTLPQVIAALPAGMILASFGVSNYAKLSGVDHYLGETTLDIVSYADGLRVQVRPYRSNTSGDVTLDLAGRGARPVLLSGNRSLSPGQLQSGKVSILIYDGENDAWILTDQPPVFGVKEPDPHYTQEGFIGLFTMATAFIAGGAVLIRNIRSVK